MERSGMERRGVDWRGKEWRGMEWRGTDWKGLERNGKEWMGKERIEGKEVTLLDARRIWYWDGAASLSQLAMEGVKKPKKCKFAVPVDEILLLETIEIIPTTKGAEECIKGVKEWKN